MLLLSGQESQTFTAGVVDTVARLLPQDVQALAVDVSHAPVPEVSILRLQGKEVRGVSEDHLVPSSTPKLHLDGAHDFADRVVYPQLLHRDNQAVLLQPGVGRVKQRRHPLQHRRGYGEEVGAQPRYHNDVKGDEPVVPTVIDDGATDSPRRYALQKVLAGGDDRVRDPK